jgi:cytochrome c556
MRTLVIATLALTSMAPLAAQAGADEEIAYRKAVIETVYFSARATGAALQGALDDKASARLKYNAQQLAFATANAKDAFRVNTTGLETKEKTTVKADGIWKNWADFSKRMDVMSAAAAGVNAAVKKGDKKTAGEQLKLVFGQCKSCHETYRTE